MNNSQDKFEEKLVKEAKILKLKAIKAWHLLKKKSDKAWKDFDKQTGASRMAKKLVLAAGLKLITLAAPNAQISLHAQTIDHKNFNKELIAKANVAAKEQPELSKFIAENQDAIIERQQEFASTLWDVLNKNVKKFQVTEAKGKRPTAKELNRTFADVKKQGITIDPRYYCASAGLGSMMQTINENGFEEYQVFIDLLTNPNSCLSIIKDIKKNFGNIKESSNIQKTLAEIYENNPRAVCIAFPHSRGNSSSGYHYVTVFSNTIAVDTLVSEKDTKKGKVASFNRTAISNTEDYFTGSQNRGYVFDITSLMANYQAFDMFMKALQEQENKPSKPRKSVRPEIENNAPVALIKETEDRLTRWSKVGRLQKEPEEEPNLVASYLKSRGRGQRLS